MKCKLVSGLRYVLQVLSLIFFIYLFTNLHYPAGWHAAALKWLSRLDPWGLFGQLRWQRSFPVWGWLPIAVLIITLLFGRVFCGWFCPFGALLMLVDKVSRMILKNKVFRKISSVRTKIIYRLQPLRYFWLLFLVIAFLIGRNWAYTITPFALFSRETARILMGKVPWVLIAVIVFTILLSRFWCSVICPTGLFLSLLSRLRIFRYKTDDHCVHCSKCMGSCPVGVAAYDTGTAGEGCLVCGECKNICPVHAIKYQPAFFEWKNKETAAGIDRATVTGKKAGSDMQVPDNQHTRREFIKITGTSMLAAVIALGGRTVKAARKVLRPPGALPESKFTSVCNRCGRCIKVCPNNALHPMPLTDGIECFDTPQIIPRKANCSLCLTCQEVCPTGAIAKVPLEQIHIGKAYINTQRCLAWKDGKFCLICVEQCPYQAIEADSQNRPYIHTDLCAGCGTCERACAVSGEAAIRVQPK